MHNSLEKKNFIHSIPDSQDKCNTVLSLALRYAYSVYMIQNDFKRSSTYKYAYHYLRTSYVVSHNNLSKQHYKENYTLKRSKVFLLKTTSLPLGCCQCTVAMHFSSTPVLSKALHPVH